MKTESSKRVLHILGDALYHQPQILSISLVGSSTRAYVQSPSDFDFLAITEKKVEIDGFLEKLPSMPSAHEVASHRWEIFENTVRAKANDTIVSIAFLDAGQLTSELNAAINECDPRPEYRSWSIGGYVPEVLLGDIVDSVTVFDKLNQISAWKNMLENTYPPKLRQEILSYSSSELVIKGKILAQAATLGDELWLNCSIYSLTLPLVRGVFAQNKIYFRGMKHLSSQLEYYVPRELALIKRLTNITPQNLEPSIDLLNSIITLFEASY